MKALHNVANRRRTIAKTAVDARRGADVENPLDPGATSLAVRLAPRARESLHDRCTIWMAFREQVSGPLSARGIDIHTLDSWVIGRQEVAGLRSRPVRRPAESKAPRRGVSPAAGHSTAPRASCCSAASRGGSSSVGLGLCRRGHPGGPVPIDPTAGPEALLRTARVDLTTGCAIPTALERLG